MKLLAGRTQDLADVEAILGSGADREALRSAVERPRQAASRRWRDSATTPTGLAERGVAAGAGRPTLDTGTRSASASCTCAPGGLACRVGPAKFPASEPDISVSLSPGAHIGAFAVLGLIGRGGMGEVYRARDTRLKREVALKVLPEAVAGDPERVARFQREAEILATLSHPSIATIHGIEETPAPGPGPASLRALVMELVEGPTLADRIARGPLPLDESLPIARQIVDALDYAHEHGVLHRDLKPANIKITPEGQVKVLDFGLAKAFASPARSAPALAEASPTITSPAFTQAGVILGTAAYMAPEQVRGQVLDKRADIWAFGCVLYEMLAGTRAFAGETTSDTLAAVLKSDPDWTKLPPSMSGPVRQLLARCLDRDPRSRLRDIADARMLLETASAPGGAHPAPARNWRWLLAGLGALAAAFIAGSWYSAGTMGAPGTAPVRRVTVQLPVPLSTSSTGGGSSLAIAPDGSAIAFTGRGGTGVNQVHVHLLADATNRVLRVPSLASVGSSFPAFSRDGRLVLFNAGGRLWQSEIDGTEPELLCSAEGRGNLRGTVWSEQHRGLVASNAGLLEVAQRGAACELVVPIDSGRGEARFLSPQVLPDGRGILLTVSGTSDDASSASIVVVPAERDERRLIVRGARGGRLTASGHLLFARGDQVLAAPFDLPSLAINGEPVKVLDGVASGQFSTPLMDVSARGDLVYAPGHDTGNRLVWITRTGARSDAGAPTRTYLPEPVLSRDGKRAIVTIGTGDHTLWLWALDTGTLTPLVTGRDTHGPVWSPDGRKIAVPFYDRGIAIKDLESPSEPELVWEGPGSVPLAWSPDGATIVFGRTTSAGGPEIAALSMADRQATRVLSASELRAEFSPDGRWLAYVATESGRREVYVTDFPAAKIRRPVSTDGGFAPAWSPDGRELFYVSNDSMMVAAVRPGPSAEFERPVRLFSGIDFATSASPYSVAPDGRFLFVEEGDVNAPNRNQLTLVLNWFEELNRLVPAR
jgi:Tol biopolymer transport system component